ncbi:MAG: exonuclease SbcCD subunit D [Archaeoglobaceae archaeon]
MKFAHFADIHLGYEQYNLPWRADDFANALKNAVKIAVSEKVDFAIIAGDLFHRSVPNPKTLNDAIEALGIFKESGIPVFAIEGNHDKSIREMSAYNLLENLGLLNVLGLRKERVERDNVTSVRLENVYLVKGVYKDVEIIGDKHRTRWQLEKVLPLMKSDGKSILVLHQAVKEVVDVDLEMSWDLTIDQLPEADYYALGHVHVHREKKIGDRYLVYPGSTERYDSREASSFFFYGERLETRSGEKKGFCIVENFKPRFLEIETRDLYAISIDSEKKVDAEKKFLEVLNMLKSSAIAVVKITCSETIDSKKILEIALNRLKHAEINFKRRGVEDVSRFMSENEFFNDFEMKLLELLRDGGDMNIKSAIELVKEHFSIESEVKSMEAKTIERKMEEVVQEKKEERKEVKKKVKTLLDFV